MAIEYTTKEKKIINNAWDLVIHLTDSHSSFSYYAKEALKADKKERGSITASKAILIDSFLDGIMNPEKPISGLNWLCRGSVELLILGAAMKTRFPEDIKDRHVAEFKHAVDTHKKAMHKSLDEILGA